MTLLNFQEFDIIYLSYDEPNAEKNYADLCSKFPWAKRVHGVKGSDAAHKACASVSDTDRFITVDGDNQVRPEFLTDEIDVTGKSEEDLSKLVISWCGRNHVNGLMYGNGGVKCWSKEYVFNMRTHENADPANIMAQVDFCWDAEYYQMNHTASDTYINESPKQAWRAGFREGVKLSLDRGIPVEIKEFKQLHWRCLHWLYIWSMVGLDVKNGEWAILGARQGIVNTMLDKIDHTQVRDFDFLDNYWEFSKDVDVKKLTSEYGLALRNHLDVPIASDPLNSDQSKFFKATYQSPTRTDKFK